MEHFDIRILSAPGEAAQHLPTAGRAAVIGETDAGLPGFAPNNPQAVLDYLHFHRAFKTPYELDRMRQAQQHGALGHLRRANRPAGGPIAINAASCWQPAQGQEAPKTNRPSMKTARPALPVQAYDPPPIAFLLIDAAPRWRLCLRHHPHLVRNDARFRACMPWTGNNGPGGKRGAPTDYPTCTWIHLRLARVRACIVDMEPGSMLAAGVTSVFFPHGLGHPIGLQVHDVAGFSDVDGKLIPRPEGHPFLRMTRTLEPGMVVTIEPGIYFIPSLLAGLRAGANAKAVDWNAIEHLSRFGGVRIEDEVHCTDGAPENLTRNAFEALA